MFYMSFSGFNTNLNMNIVMDTLPSGDLSSIFLLSYGILDMNIATDIPPDAESYNRLTFAGDCVLDGIHAYDYELTDANIEAKASSLVADAWTNDSIILGNFENTLECGSLITTLNVLLEKYIIYRKIKGTSLNYLLDTITDVTQHTYIDYIPRNNVEYTYTVVPSYDDSGVRIDGSGLEGDESVSFWGWILSDTEAVPVESYNFNLELETSDIIVKKDFKMSENNTQYPSFRFGNMEYKQMTLTTIPYLCTSDEFVTDVNLLDDLLAFINNGEEKVLRSPSGEAWKVVTINGKYKYKDKIQVGTTQPYAITFEVFETGSLTP